MNTFTQNANFFIKENRNRNENEILELIPIITFPIIATTIIQLLIQASQLLIKVINQETVLQIIAALIAGEIVYIITLVLEHAFNKVDRALTKLQEEIKEKDKIIMNLLLKQDDDKTQTN